MLAIWHLIYRPDPPRTIADFDRFQQDLADRVQVDLDELRGSVAEIFGEVLGRRMIHEGD